MAAVTKNTPRLASGKQLAGQLSYGQIQALYIQQGGNPAFAKLMAAITEPESGRHTDAVNYDPSRYSPPAGAGAYGGTVDTNNQGALAVGLWQINIAGNPGLQQQGFTAENLLDPVNNAKAAVILSGSSAQIQNNWAETVGAAQGILSSITSGPSSLSGYNTNPAGFTSQPASFGGSISGVINNAGGAVENAGSSVGSAVAGFLGLPSLGSIEKDITYAAVIVGGGLIMIVGLVLVAADIGLMVFSGRKNPVVVVQERQSQKRQAASAAAEQQRQETFRVNQEANRERVRQVRETRATEIHRARLRTERAKARTHEAHAKTAQAGTSEAKRRAERARGITSSEIAQLQMGK